MKRMPENWQKMPHLTRPEEIKISMSEFSNQSLEYLILPESKRMLKNKPKLTGVHQRDTGSQSKKLPILLLPRTTWTAKYIK